MKKHESALDKAITSGDPELGECFENTVSAIALHSYMWWSLWLFLLSFKILISEYSSMVSPEIKNLETLASSQGVSAFMHCNEDFYPLYFNCLAAYPWNPFWFDKIIGTFECLLWRCQCYFVCNHFTLLLGLYCCWCASGFWTVFFSKKMYMHVCMLSVVCLYRPCVH